MTDHYLLMLIIFCEAAFWLFLCLGLLSRYLFQQKTLSQYLLLCVPLVDVVLLVATVLDLEAGSNATFAHGLAAAYLGFTIAFGSLTIRWADQRFAYRFAGGPMPTKLASEGLAGLLVDLKLWFRCCIAVAITLTLVYSAIIYINDATQTAELDIWLTIPLFTLSLWFLFGPGWALIAYLYSLLKTRFRSMI